MTHWCAVTNAVVWKGPDKQFIITPDGKGETCVLLYLSLSEGEKVP